MTSLPDDWRDRISVCRGDITTLDVDAIVTAANESLCGGGGVDGAVHRRAGPGLFEECRTIGYCPEGEARLTRGYLLPARHVIHTVGPVWEGGEYNEPATLATCYLESLKLAAEHSIGTIAFPCIATGSYGFPKPEACEIAVSTVTEWVRKNSSPRQIIFCCFDAEDAELYHSRLETVA